MQRYTLSPYTSKKNIKKRGKVLPMITKRKKSNGRGNQLGFVKG
jgi:hypothetical protein